MIIDNLIVGNISFICLKYHDPIALTRFIAWIWPEAIKYLHRRQCYLFLMFIIRHRRLMHTHRGVS